MYCVDKRQGERWKAGVAFSGNGGAEALASAVNEGWARHMLFLSARRCTNPTAGCHVAMQTDILKIPTGAAAWFDQLAPPETHCAFSFSSLLLPPMTADAFRSKGGRAANPPCSWTFGHSHSMQDIDVKFSADWKHGSAGLRRKNGIHAREAEEGRAGQRLPAEASAFLGKPRVSRRARRSPNATAILRPGNRSDRAGRPAAEGMPLRQPAVRRRRRPDGGGPQGTGPVRRRVRQDRENDVAQLGGGGFTKLLFDAGFRVHGAVLWCWPSTSASACESAAVRTCPERYARPYPARLEHEQYASAKRSSAIAASRTDPVAAEAVGVAAFPLWPGGSPSMLGVLTLLGPGGP